MYKMSNLENYNVVNNKKKLFQNVIKKKEKYNLKLLIDLRMWKLKGTKRNKEKKRQIVQELKWKKKLLNWKKEEEPGKREKSSALYRVRAKQDEREYDYSAPKTSLMQVKKLPMDVKTLSL